MSNFMGPMAPPPAAQPQPQALDFKTDPNQRQRFRQFMRERVGSGAAQAPAAMPNGIGTTMPTPQMPMMPQIPMMPQPAMMPPMPMDAGIDVFSPQYMNQIPMQPSAGFHEGGIVGGLNDLGQMSSQMVEALNTTIYGGGQGGGGGYGGGMPPPPSGPMSTGGGFGGGNMPPPLPPVQQPVIGNDSEYLEEMPRPVFNLIPDEIQNTMYGGIPGADNSGAGTGLASTVAPSPDGLNPSIQDTSSSLPVPQDVAFAYAKAQEDARKQREGGFLGRVMLPGEMSFEDFSQGYNYRFNNPQPPLAVISQPGFGDGTMGNLMDVGPTGGVTSGQQSPGDMMDIIGPLEAYMGGSKYFDESTGLYTGPDSYRNKNIYKKAEIQDALVPYKFADGGSVSDALADALSNDIGDYSFDDTFTDLSQTSYNDFDPGGNESFDAAAMDQFRNQQKSDLSDIIGQQIQSSIKSNQQMGTPAPVPQSVIEQMQFENLQNVPSTEPVFSMPNLNLGGMSTSFDLLGNPLTIGFKDGGSVPPRETDIRGMYHELAYITPDEADILEALGGTGEAGPMGIPTYIPDDGNRGTDTDTSDAPSGPSGGESSSSGSDSSSDSDSSNSGNDGYDPGDYVGYTEDEEQQQTKDMQDYEENVFGGDSPDGYSVQDILNDNAEKAAIERAIATTNAINTANQQRFNNLDQRLAQTQLDPMGTLTNPNNEILDFDAGPVVGDIEVNSIGGVNTGASKGTSSNNDLLGGIDDLLSSLDKTISKVSGPTASEINAFRAAEQAGTSAPVATSTQTPTVVGNSDDETYDPDLDKATKAALTNAGVDQSVIDKISRGSSQSGLESEGILGALGIGPGKAYTGGVNNRFGTATGPGRLSTVTAKEMEALRTGNAVQRQMYRQLAGIKSAGPVLSSFDPNNVEGNFFDTMGNLLSKPSSAIEVFRAPITEQQGFKSVNTGNFKDGISGVTGEGNTPGFMGGIMQMFGIDPIVYTGDNRFDPNQPPEDFGGGRDDDVLLPLPPEEEVAPPPIVQMPGFFGPPPAPTEPAPVLVPSTRVSNQYTGKHLLNSSMPVGYGTPQTGQIDPYAMAEMQRYKEMLARLNQPRSPIGLANGGSVLDAAAGKFLESLTAA